DADEASFRCRVRDRDDTYVWLEWKAACASDDGSICAVGRAIAHPAAADVVRQGSAEEALRAIEERFRTFMDNSPAIAMMKDEEGRYVYVSGRWLEEYELAEEDVLGKTPYDLFPRDIAEHYRRHEQEVLATEQTILSVEPRQRRDGTRG